MAVVRFELRACRRQWKVFDSPLHDRDASFRAQLVLDVPVNLFHRSSEVKKYKSMIISCKSKLY